MKWTKHYPTCGDVRIKNNKFLFLPYVMFVDDNTIERRWIEKASWEEEYQFVGKNNGIPEYAWLPVRWIN